MKTKTNTDTIRQDTKTPPTSLPGKVCLHVLRDARYDVRAMRTASALAQAGVVVTIVDVADEHRPPAKGDMENIRIKSLSMHGSFSSSRFERWPLIKALVLFVKSIFQLLSTPTDLFHACEVTALPASYIASRLRRKPLIFEAYELPLGDKPITTMGRSRRVVHWLLTLLLAHIVPRCQGVITVSPPIVEAIRSRYAVSPVALIRNVPPYRTVAKSNRLRELLGLSSETKIALYQGYLQPDRSLDILVRAARYLDPGIVIILMGKAIGTTQRQLETLITQEGVAERVKIIPAVPYEELLDWTASADVGLIVCAPDYAPNIQMLLPNKLFEYLMAGLPVLASPLDAVADVINTYHVGQIVSSLAPSAIGAAINQICSDQDNLAHMSRNALQAAHEEFCWEREKVHLLSFYEHIA